MQNKEQIWQYLSSFPKGERRKAALENIDWTPIITTGANVTLYCQDRKSVSHLLLIDRQKSDESPDGVGALGGLSEYIDSEEFEHLNKFEQYRLIGKKDNVILCNKHPMIITDTDTICRKTVLREMKEELGNLNISIPALPWGEMNLIVESDYDIDFLVNHWDGKGPVFIVKAYCYAMLVDEKIIDNLVYQSQQGVKQINSELSGLQKVPVVTAASYPVGRGKNNYRYFHEQLVCHKMIESSKNPLHSRFICSSTLKRKPFLGHTHQCE